MYILRIKDKENKNIKDALELLKANGFDVNMDPLYKFITKEEVINVLECGGYDLPDKYKEEVIEVATDELFYNYDIFDSQLIIDVLNRVVSEIVEGDE